MIKTIIFDIGGVLTHTDFGAAYTNFAKKIGILPDLVTGYHLSNIKALILGKITFTEFGDEMKKAGADMKADLKKIWIEEMLKVRTVDHGVLDTITSLRKNYSVGTLTNLTESRFIVDEAMKLYDNFDYAVLSFREHMEKPDPAFYQLALDRAGAKAEEAIFVDDQEKCIKGAESIGIRSILFVDKDKLISDLKDLSVIGL